MVVMPENALSFSGATLNKKILYQLHCSFATKSQPLAGDSVFKPLVIERLRGVFLLFMDKVEA